MDWLSPLHPPGLQAGLALMVSPPKEGDPSYEQHKAEEIGILESLRRRAQLMTDGFNACEGVTCNYTEGAMYSFPKLNLPPKVCSASPTPPGCSMDVPSASCLDALMRRLYMLCHAWWVHQMSCGSCRPAFRGGSCLQKMLHETLVTLPPLCVQAMQAAKKAGKAPDTWYCLELLQATGILTVPGATGALCPRPGPKTHHIWCTSTLQIAAHGTQVKVQEYSRLLLSPDIPCLQR